MSKRSTGLYDGGPYRSRKGNVFGVCRGLAEHFDFNVTAMRLLWVVGGITLSFPVILIYIVLAFMLKPEPVMPLESAEDAEFYSSFTASKSMALHRLKRTYDNLDRRIQRMESIVTAKEYEWDARLNDTNKE